MFKYLNMRSVKLELIATIELWVFHICFNRFKRSKQKFLNVSCILNYNLLVTVIAGD